MVESLIFDFGKWEIQCQDHAVLGNQPLILTQDCWTDLSKTAESLAHECLLAEEELLRKPRLISKLGIPSSVHDALKKASSAARASRGPRLMRFDFHYTEEGWLISEANTDVPGGLNEAAGFQALSRDALPGTRGPGDPAAAYVDSVCASLQRSDEVALVTATGYSDDLQVMHYLASLIQKKGFKSRIVSPDHLVWTEGLAWMDSAWHKGPLGAVVRFFPGEWLSSLSGSVPWHYYFYGSETPMSNPATSLLTQSKRFPLVWDELETDLSTWGACLPETRELPASAGRCDPDWVLKPALGRVGAGIGIHGVTREPEYRKILVQAFKQPREWAYQRRFKALPLRTETGPVFPCVGVFTVDGRTVGAYGRIGGLPLIDESSQDVPVRVSLGA